MPRFDVVPVGASVVVASDADGLYEALELVDVVVIEANMIDRDVIEVLEMTRRKSPDLPLVLVGVADGDGLWPLATGSTPNLVLPSTVAVGDARRAISALLAS